MPQVYVQERKESPLDTIMKGLTVASQIYGIRANMATLEEHKAKMKANEEAKAEKERIAAGRYNKNEVIGFQKDYDVSTTKPQGIPFQEASDLAGSPLYIATRRKAVEPKIQEVRGMKGGVYGTSLVDLSSGKPVEVGFYAEKPEAPKSPEKVGTRLVETIDAQGNPIQQIVEDKPGQVFGTSAKTAASSKPSKEQFDAATFGRRVEAANQVLEELAAKGFDRTSFIEAGKAFILPEAGQSAELKTQRQAERNFVNAVLRRESGAAISKSEFDSAEMQYFPRAGDTPEVLAIKEQNRLQALAGLQGAAGNAWDLVPLVARPKVKGSTEGKAFGADKDMFKIELPKVGAIEDGFMFQGGDPKDPQNWKIARPK